MTPYADFTYFGILLYPVLPTVLLGLAGRLRQLWALSRAWVLLATLAMLVVQYWGPVTSGLPVATRELYLVAGFALGQWVIALAFLWARRRVKSRALFWSVLLAALLPLVMVKLLPLLAPGSLFGFLGISYVTFRALDVVFGIQDRLITSLPPLQFLAYLLFFPTISSGPIDRYRRFAEDWQRRRTAREVLVDLDGAVHRLFTGLLYKFILAALIKQYWLDPSAGGGLLSTVSYMYAYSFYLFFDFAGYSAFAVGISYLFGIHTPENFHRPFLARNIRDFWNRWHISLSTWFRDHVYMRFLLAATRGRWFRDKHVASYVGLLLSFGLMGAWHGLQPHYLVYGVYMAALLIGFDLFERWNKQHGLWGTGPGWRMAEILVTFHAVSFGLLLFSGRLGPGLG